MSGPILDKPLSEEREKSTGGGIDDRQGLKKQRLMSFINSIPAVVMELAQCLSHMEDLHSGSGDRLRMANPVTQ